MTGWRDGLHLSGKGSFRGVEFFVEEVEGRIGRRAIIHEFPGRDEPFAEDNGKAARKFSLAAYVLGDGYMAQRDRLVAALETSGPGKLVHPYWGEMQVVVAGEVVVRETTREGGMARFDIPVTKAGKEPSPTTKPDTKAQLDAAATDAQAALGEAFEDGFSVSDAIGDVRDSVLGTINNATSMLNSAQGEIAASLSIIDDTKAAIDAFADAASDLIDTPSDLANQFTALVGSVYAGIDEIGDSIDEVFGRFRVDTTMAATRDLMAFGDDETTPPDTTPQRRLEEANQEAVINLVRTAAVVEAARTIRVLPFESFDQASSVRDELVEFLDEVAGEASSDDLYSALADVRTAVVRHLNQAASDLPSIVSFTPAQPMPALVIAHRLYGDPTRDAEIIARNNIRNPAMVPGQVTLKVLDE